PLFIRLANSKSNLATIFSISILSVDPAVRPGCFWGRPLGKVRLVYPAGGPVSGCAPRSSWPDDRVAPAGRDLWSARIWPPRNRRYHQEPEETRFVPGGRSRAPRLPVGPPLAVLKPSPPATRS